MYSSSLLVLALAVFGASAQTIVSSGCGLNGISGLGVSGLTGLNTLTPVSSVSTLSNCGTAVGSTPVVENVPIRLPGFVSPTTVQDSCSCVKTIVKPVMRKEIISVPSVQRFVQTTSTPVVETVPYVRASAMDVPAVPSVSAVEFPSVNVQTVVPSVGTQTFVPSVSGVVSGFGGINSGLSNVVGINSGVSSGLSTGFGVSC